MVMVMAGRAQPVARLGLPVGERVDQSRLRERAQRAVDRGQPDPLAAGRHPAMKLLGGCVVVLARELLEHAHALRGGPHSRRRHSLDQIRALHAVYDTGALRTIIVLIHR